MAPEIIKKEPYSEKVDIWATGVVAYIMLFGKAPFKGKKKSEIFEQIKKCDISYGDASPQAVSFCKKMLCLDKNLRFSAKDLLNHPWLLNNTQKLEVESEALLNIGNNLKEFRSASVF